jgi:hypothetical protein
MIGAPDPIDIASDYYNNKLARIFSNIRGCTMPFPQQSPTAFTRREIEAIKPNQSGVYGLFRQGISVYVGKGDIRQRLLDHFNGDNPCITRQGPTHFRTEVTANMDERERQLISELQPICNQRLG